MKWESFYIVKNGLLSSIHRYIQTFVYIDWEIDVQKRFKKWGVLDGVNQVTDGWMQMIEGALHKKSKKNLVYIPQTFVHNFMCYYLPIVCIVDGNLDRKMVLDKRYTLLGLISIIVYLRK